MVHPALPEFCISVMGLHIKEKVGGFFIFDLKCYFPSDLHKTVYVLKRKC